MKKLSILSFTSLFCLSSFGASVSCYEDPATNAQTCLNLKVVKEKDGIRSAPLFTGGPKEINDTGFTMAANCATGATHLKDRKGVSFAGGNGTETKAMRNLHKWLCDAPLKK